ncbi:hypothetical protein AQV86_02295 [Nanohaloarchaea archaeon SG9]|nr:hypothetical protein AQV86_02295 [Nanohaloarchaea archaeon SG9]
MEKEELREHLSEYRDSRSRQKLVQALKEELISEIEQMDISTSRQEHDLNMLIRDLEEELDWIESEKLAEFDPEHE